MPRRRIVARPSGSQRARARRRGRLAPINGSVTRADIEAIFADFMTDAVDPPPTVEEFVTHLRGAIQDWTPGPHLRRRISRSQRERRAREREQRQAQEQLAQPPSQARAAA